jgi:hypothetical protein
MFWFDRFLVRLFKGSYSYDYVQVFRDHNRRSPFVPCYKDDAVFHFIKFFENRDNLPVYKTSQAIRFAFADFFVSEKDLRKQKGKSDCFSVTQENNVEIRTYGYNSEIFSSKTKENYYFVGNALFMGEYYFSDARKIDIKKLFASLIEKYIKPSEHKLVQGGSFYIEDSNGAVLHAEDNGFTVAIRYFCKSDETVKSKLEAFLEGGKLKAETRYAYQPDDDDFDRL